MIRRIAILALLAFVAGPRSGYARGSGEKSAEARRDAENKARAKKLAGRGARYFKERRWKDALERFSQAYRLYESPKILVNIGACHEQMGDLGRALDAYEEFLDTAPTESPDFKKVEALAKAVTARVGTVRIEAPMGTKVFIDERLAGTAPLDPIRVQSGPRKVRLVPAKGVIFFSATANVQVGRSLTIRFPGSEPAQPSESRPAPVAEPATSAKPETGGEPPADAGPDD